MNDAELVQASKVGDENAFRQIVERYESLVASTVIGMLGNCPEAEDVGQETFVRFHKSLHNFRGDSAVGTYLTRIAINLSLNELKRRQKKLSLFKKHVEDDFNIPDNTNEHYFDDKKEIVQQAIQKLEPKFRAVIILRLMDGYSTTETARILKVPVGTVLSRLARAQKKLKAILTPYWGELK